jgi:cob(I)alamin adenosyltransferase
MSKSTIYTRTGDKGSTSLVDGSRVAKDSLRVEAYGTIDEANSWVGRALAGVADPVLSEPLTFLQHRLYNCSSNVAVPPGADGVVPTKISAEDVAYLEACIDRFEQRSGPMKCFVLPGGTEEAGRLHVARTVCRRAERRLMTLGGTEAVDPQVLKFINRASDVLFAAARYANATLGEGDVPWNKDLPEPS